MITFRGKARPRKRTSTPVLVESARLRKQLTRIAAGVQAFAEELREEVDRLTETDEREGDGDDH
jgi:hypothetical protein